jgi:hypothetical protein
VPAPLFELGDVLDIIAYSTTKTGVLDVVGADSTAAPGSKGGRCYTEKHCRCLIVQKRHSGRIVVCCFSM